MTKLKIKQLAFPGAGKEIFEKGKERLSNIFSDEQFELNENAEIWHFLTGGSEYAALESAQSNKFYILIADQDGNSYAAATEVKAFLNTRNIKSVLLDANEPESKEYLQKLYGIQKAIDSLKNQNLGLIGKVSGWLIASEIKAKTLKKRFGINLKPISWDTLPEYKEMKISQELIDTFASKIDLSDTAQVYDLLQFCIKQNHLDAITVECFPMVRKSAVTACLPLAKFNNDGFPAGCEGDLTSIAGMMFAKAITGNIPWMANTVKIASPISLFAHCTIAPKFVDNCKVTTHYETGVGTAISGEFKADIITIFRFDADLKRYFLTKAKVVNRPNYPEACRTQIEIELSEKAIKSLRENPLGNHHLILAGDYLQEIEMACMLLNLEEV